MDIKRSTIHLQTFDEVVALVGKARTQQNLFVDQYGIQKLHCCYHFEKFSVSKMKDTYENAVKILPYFSAGYFYSVFEMSDSVKQGKGDGSFYSQTTKEAKARDALNLLYLMGCLTRGSRHNGGWSRTSVWGLPKEKK